MTRALSPRYYFVAVPFLGRGTTDAAPARERTVDGRPFPRARLCAVSSTLPTPARFGVDGDRTVRLLLRQGPPEPREEEAAGRGKAGRCRRERRQRRECQRSPEP